jgi:hypothetical protein
MHTTTKGVNKMAKDLPQGHILTEKDRKDLLDERVRTESWLLDRFKEQSDYYHGTVRESPIFGKRTLIDIECDIVSAEVDIACIDESLIVGYRVYH